jgi:hypothetical protein
MFLSVVSSIEFERDGTLFVFESPTAFHFQPTRSGPVQLILFPIKVCALACGTCLGALMIPATLPLPIICLEMSDGFRVILRQASEYGGTTDRYLRRSLGML